MRRLSVLILTILLLLPVSGRAEADRYIFEHLQTSNHWINDIFQDADGFIWVSTRNGLYRYLGEGPADYEAIREGCSFKNISQDADGLIWAMSRHGMAAYDPKTCVFYDYDEVSVMLGSEQWIDRFEIEESNNYWWNEGNSIYVRAGADRHRMLAGECKEKFSDLCVSNNTVYVLTEQGSIYRFALQADYSVSELPVLNITEDIQSTDQICHKIMVDSSHNVWVIQGSTGVWHFRNGSRHPQFLSYTDPVNPIQPGYINSIIEDRNGDVWLASDHGGITICDRTGQVKVRLTNDPTDDNTLSSNGIYALSLDHEGNVWVGYTKMGMSVYRGENKTWSMSHLRTLHEMNLHDDINNICEDNDGNLWLGTDGYGIICLDPRTGRETIYTKDNSSLGSNIIADIHCDPAGRIWAGTFYGGMSCIENGRVRTWRTDGFDGGLVSDNVWSIDNDDSGRIWLGTLGGGVQVFDPHTGEFVTFDSQNSGLSNNSVQELQCADDGNVYVATAYGLSIINPVTGTVEVCSQDNMIIGSITGVFVDSRGLVWLDEDGILQVFDPRTNNFYTPSYHALKAVRSIVEGSDKAIWVVTDNGICRLKVYNSLEEGYAFDISSFSFPQQSDLHFNQRSICKTDDGDFIIGSFCGYMCFHQKMFFQQQAYPDLNPRFISLYIGKNKINPGQEYRGRIILDRSVGYTDEVRLSHDMSIFSLEYTCLDYLSVHDAPLYYMMQGLSDEWITTDGHKGRITFTNLTPGRYVLWLTPDKSDSAKGISMMIRVLPPWWATWWAIMTYFVMIAAAGVIAWVFADRRRREKIERLEQSIKQERRHYVDEMKVQFFTNVSHDFRTPLTLILTPVEEMLAKNPELKHDKFIMTIHRNAQRLLNLVNEMLDLRRMEMYGTHLSMNSANIVNVVKDTVETFRLMSESQNVELVTASEMDTLVFDFDSGKIVKILTNLLSNAFKFTPSGGYIHVNLTMQSDDMVRIEVRDSGRGVPDKDKRRIFDRFYQSKGSPAGSGIGLHVVREFVLLHGGEIDVQDNDPVGSVFAFTLPVRVFDRVTDDVDHEDDESAAAEASDVEGRSTVLVVDDNDDFRMFMCASLSDEYSVLSASDGVEALRTIEANDVDVVVSDVMMPVMDGTELCRRMKSDINTSHIPVILLTAKAMKDDEFTGLEAGADDYLTKPFNMSILRLRIAKFIEWKRRAKRMFEKELEVTTEQITITTMDDRLLQQAINVINENISNPEFSVSELSAALCMHRTSLYKKLVFITGRTPIEFIRSIRLKKAAALLETDGVYVSEIAYMVGFNSPKVFAGHFKDEFGCSPTEYRKRHQRSTV